MRTGNIIKLIAIVLIVAAAVIPSIPYLSNPDQGISLGLDLRGGVHLVLQAQPGENGQPVTDEDLENAKAIIERRVNEMGVSEPYVQPDYDKKRIIVDLAGIENPDQAVNILRTTAKLTFRDPQGNMVMEGSELKDARPGTTSEGYVVSFKLSPEGTKKFADLTTKFLGQNIGIYLDDKLLQNPNVKTPIVTGEGQITGYSSLEEAANYAVLLRSGALPVSLDIVEKRQVGAALGVDSLNKSINAAVYGIIFILLFMLGWYRLPGLVANFALIVYGLIVLWGLWSFDAVLTLPGIAGFILSIGMAVDLNIIIYERIKEEIKMGKSLRAAVEAGFSRAFITVFDSNITTMFAAATLFMLGTGPIKGFALTLGIGIIASLFTAVTFTRWVLRWVVGINPRMNPVWFGARREA